VGVFDAVMVKEVNEVPTVPLAVSGELEMIGAARVTVRVAAVLANESDDPLVTIFTVDRV
jgi:hypothetical protein